MKLERRKANTLPKEWNANEEKKLLAYLKSEVYDSKKIKALFPNRTNASIRSKVRKLRIKYDLFGAIYREQKEAFTIAVANKIKPKTIFDAYAGAGHQTFKWIQIADVVYASEKMKSKLKQFEKSVRENGFTEKSSEQIGWKLYVKESKKIYFFLGDAVDAAAEIKVRRVKVDAIDLDTCGSTLPALPTFLVLLKPKHVIITHGEFHSMRFKREDVLRRLLIHRDISISPFPLDVEQMCNELDKAVKTAALRAHNETVDSFWLNLKNETWLGGKFHGMLRRHYKVEKPIATSDCINEISY